jgi:hypothetical protein
LHRVSLSGGSSIFPEAAEDSSLAESAQAVPKPHSHGMVGVMKPPPPRLAARFLERALLFALLVHAVALLSMLLLLAGLPGGGTAGGADRAAYVAGYPLLWRLGWFPWQLAAVSDLLLAVALLATPWVPRLPAVLALLVTLVAAVPEQSGEFLWVTHGVALAAEAVRTGDPDAYLRFEADAMFRIAFWAACWYVGAGLAWTWCFAGAGTWTRSLTWLSAVTWAVLLAAGVVPALPEGLRPEPAVVAGANAVGFLLLLAWLAAANECVLRRCRPDAAHGRLAPWRHPTGGALGRALECLANSRLARAAAELAPPVAFASDIRDVFYVNYLVDAERLEPLVPAGLELQRLGPGGRYALFTFLTYRHGHFGPRLLGPLRRLMPSPVQSNWRIYVRDPRTDTVGVYFVTTAINATPHALAARLLAEGLPMHLLRQGEVSALPDGSFRLRLDPGQGSAPDAEAVLRPAPEPCLSAPWGECFAGYRDMLAYAVPQDRAFSTQPWYGRLTRQEIRLGIPLDRCEPLEGRLQSCAARELVGDAVPVSFRVAEVAFCFDREGRDPCPSAVPA